MGVTFKENCPDVRNTKVIDVLEALKEYGIEADVTDPCADPAEMQRQYGVELVAVPSPAAYDGILLAVPHDAFRGMTAAEIRKLGKDPHVFFDMKSLFSKDESDLRL
jgi:UDP-N-acetyl-D-galactosamine dehydrogenase